MSILTSPPLYTQPLALNKKVDLAFDGRKRDDKEVKSQTQLKLKKSWETAISPGKAIPMNAFMLWMAGNGIQIFSIVITVMMLYNPIVAIANSAKVFSKFELDEKRLISATTAPRLVYVMLQLAILGLGLWKCSSMGLLPNTTSDWLAFMQPAKLDERTQVSFPVSSLI